MANTDDLNRTIFISDNLPFLQSLDSESVDLVVIDPPFGKKQTFTGTLKPPLSELEREQERARMVEWGVYDVASAYELGVEYPDQSGNTALFKDIWRFERVVGEDWWERIQDTPVWWLIQSTRRTHGDDAAAYIAFMAQRMIEIQRILRPTGSAYLHCDHEANAYLRQMMDAVFGTGNFRNEIVWKRTARGYKGSQFTARAYNANTDTILFYAKSASAFFDMSRVMEPYDPDYFEKAYRLSDDVGRYYLDTAYNRPSANPRPNLRYEYNGFFPPHPSGWKVGRARMEELERAGDLVVKGGQLYRKIRPGPGRIRNGLWDDISEAKGSERTGYPTQKPQALARRMIEASSNPGDIVLDCFAGCAYVPVAAEETGRRWIACDMSPRALTIVLRQFSKKPELGMTVEGEEGEYDDANPRFEGKGVLRVCGPNQLPKRSAGDADADAESPRMRAGLPEIKFRQKPLESGAEIWQAFVEEWGTACWYCGREQDADRRVLQLDHVEPNKGDGTNDDCWNRALACIACNSDKSDRLTPADTMDKALAAGRIQTQARRDEISAAFGVRREWSRKRYESLPKAKELAGLMASA